MDNISDSVSMISEQPNIYETYKKPFNKKVIMSQVSDDELS